MRMSFAGRGMRMIVCAGRRESESRTWNGGRIRNGQNKEWQTTPCACASCLGHEDMNSIPHFPLQIFGLNSTPSSVLEYNLF
jgi:hypothetical protein